MPVMPSPHPTPGRLRVLAFDDGAALWAHMLGAWRADADARLIVAGALARQRVLAAEAAHRGTILGGAVDTMERLWRDVGSRAAVPPPVDDVELRARVQDALRHPRVPDILRPMADRSGDLARLSSHLKTLDDSLGDAYTPHSAVEQGIAAVRTLLAHHAVVSRARFRVLTARAAHGITYDRPLLVAPPSALRPTTGALLTALATNSAVTLYLATQPADLPTLLTQLGIDNAHVHEHFTGPTLTGRTRLIEADDEVEVAVEVAAAWAAAGVPPEDILVVVPDDDSADAAVSAASRRGLPVVAGRGAAMRDSLVGAVLERTALTLEATDGATPQQVDDLFADLRDDPDATTLGLCSDDLAPITQAHAQDTLAEADALHALGTTLAERSYHAAGGTPDCLGPQLQQAYLWLDALRTQVDTLRAHGVQPPATAREILEESVAVPRPRGSVGGVAIARPPEVASLGATHVVMTGLSAGTLPHAPATSPFISRALLDATPGLRPRDEHPDLSAVVATASAAIALVRQPQGADGITLEPSPWFTEVAVAAGLHAQADVAAVSVRQGASLRRRLQGRARTGHRDPGAVLQAMQALDLHRRDPVFPGEPPTRISVTTLEEYLRCPLGWMVGRHMSPWSPGGVNMHMGNVADHALEAALNLGGDTPVPVAPLDTRVAHALKGMQADPELAFVPRDMRDDLAGWVEATARKYYDPDYMNEIAPGWRPVAAQVWLQSDRIVDGFTITGVADRVDVTDHGLLVIDWKLQRALQIPERSRRQDELQKGLYPDMARGISKYDLPPEVLGFMYVSVAHADHVGSFTRPVGGGGAVDEGWWDDNRMARDRAALACAGIRDMRVWDTGEQCDAPWCGHRLLSTTARGGL